MSSDLQRVARKHALVNAIKHNGRADSGAVVSKVLGEIPQMKSSAKNVVDLVKEVVLEINRLSVEQQKKALTDEFPELEESPKKKIERKLDALPNAEKYARIVTRFAPNPDCVLHLGSIRAAILSHDYARFYKGKFILRFEDTDPRLKRSALEFYDVIRDDLRWLECRWDEEYCQSDRLATYYGYAEQLLTAGAAYVCTCPKPEFTERILRNQACVCRTASIQDQLVRWERMKSGEISEGKAVIRIKTELTHPNPAVRDWPALRVIDPVKYPHPRIDGGNYVWPLYNFASGIDDHLMEITHIIRGKEHYTNMIRQEYLYQHLGWKYPEAIHYGRLRIIGAPLSKSAILKSYQTGEVKDFSDPRLPTLLALRRRGITHEALRQTALEVGIKPVDSTLSMENIYAANRKIIDPLAHRYFFLANPLSLKVEGVLHPHTVRLKLHPNQKDEPRTLTVPTEDNTAHLLIDNGDAQNMRKGQIYRLMELFNFEVLGRHEKSLDAKYHSESLAKAKNAEASLIHWLPDSGNIPVTVYKPDGSQIDGLAEPSLRKEPKGSTVQFIRFGFCRIDSESEDRIVAFYAHA